MAGADNAKPERLKKRAQFLAVQRGQKLRGRLFLLESKARDDEHPARYGLTVTKKQGNAVARNRIRRRLREAIRTGAGRDMAAGNDYVVVGRRDILSAPFDDLKAELHSRLKKAAKPNNPTRSGTV